MANLLEARGGAPLADFDFRKIHDLSRLLISAKSAVLNAFHWKNSLFRRGEKRVLFYHNPPEFDRNGGLKDARYRELWRERAVSVIIPALKDGGEPRR